MPKRAALLKLLGIPLGLISRGQCLIFAVRKYSFEIEHCDSCSDVPPSWKTIAHRFSTFKVWNRSPFLCSCHKVTGTSLAFEMSHFHPSGSMPPPIRIATYLTLSQTTLARLHLTSSCMFCHNRLSLQSLRQCVHF